MRVSAKADYAVRAMAQLAAEQRDGVPVKTERIADAQEIPPKFLLGILRELKHARLVHSQRGPDGGYLLARPPEQISLADVIRAVDGPLANVRDMSLDDLRYAGPAESLREVWQAVRTSLRSVLEHVSVADLAAGRLPEDVRVLAEEYRSDDRYGPRGLPAAPRGAVRG